MFDDALSNLLDPLARNIIDWSRRACQFTSMLQEVITETQFLVLAVAIAGAKTAYYIHKTFKEVIESPLPLLTLDSRLVKVITEIKNGEVVSRDELKEVLRIEGLELAELEKNGKLIKNLKPKKWLPKLVAW